MPPFQSLSKLRTALEATGSATAVAVPASLVFDDEPVESLLLSGPSRPATSASAFQPARELIAELGTVQTPVPEPVIQRINTFLEAGHALTDPLFQSLVQLVRSVLPRWPQPADPDMPQSAGRLVFQLWEAACLSQRRDWRHSAGEALWEWYEYQHDHAAARIILHELFEDASRCGAAAQLGRLKNNFAFQYFSEGRWAEGAREFELAAALYREQQDEPARANSMANYWGCRVEQGDIAAPEAAIADLERLLQIMRDAALRMGQRKALLYLGKIHAAQENWGTARECLEEVVAIDLQQQAMYLEEDQRLLDDLRRRCESPRPATINDENRGADAC